MGGVIIIKTGEVWGDDRLAKRMGVGRYDADDMDIDGRENKHTKGQNNDQASFI